MHVFCKCSRLCLPVCVCVLVCVGGSVMFQTEGFVSASECWGAAVHAISQCFFIIFNKSVFGPPITQRQLSNKIRHSQTHRHRYKETHSQKKPQKTLVLLSKPNDLSQFLIHPADAMCFSCYFDGPFHGIFMFCFRVKGMESLISLYHVMKYKSQ